jgi:methyl-accepting chemotaxis protein
VIASAFKTFLTSSITQPEEEIMRWFYNLNVGRKLAVGFAMVLMLTAGLGLLSLHELAKVNEATVDLATDWMPSVEALAYIRFHTLNMKRRELNLLLADRRNRAFWLAQLKLLHNDLTQDWKRYEPLMSTDEERHLYEQYRAAFARFEKANEKVVLLAAAGKRKEADDLSQGEGRIALDEALDRLAENIQLNARGGQASEQAAAASYDVARRWVVGLLVGALASVALVLLVITRSIATPVRQTMEVLEALSQRDLSQTLNVNSSDELGLMAAALNRTIDSLRDTLQTISQSADQLAISSQEISAAATQTAEDAHSQSDQATQVATAMHEMASTVDQISENSQKAAEAARSAANAARNGGERVEETLSTMQEIFRSTTEAATTISELGNKSKQIGKIIAVIDDIADQTNLLALNAAIEAARAGEQGRGFAVVADEVRKLAERTTKATKEIAAMIESIQLETHKAVGAMKKGTSDVQSGVEKTTASGDALRGIIKMSEDVGDMIATIATAATQQSATTDEVNKNVSRISNSTQSSSSASEQMAKACSELSSLALDLQNLTRQFKLNWQEESHSPDPQSRRKGQRGRALTAAAGSAG